MAHDIAQIDPITKTPIAARVCYGLSGMPFSFQVDTFADVQKYIDGNMGPLLSVLCSFLWFTHVRLASVSLLERAVGPVTIVRLAGRRGGVLELDNHLGCRASARPDHTLQRDRQVDFGQHGAPRVLRRGAGVPDRNRLCAMLRWLEVHRLHDRAQGPDPQLHRTYCAPLAWPTQCLHNAHKVLTQYSHRYTRSTYTAPMQYPRSTHTVPTVFARCPHFQCPSSNVRALYGTRDLERTTLLLPGGAVGTA